MSTAPSVLTVNTTSPVNACINILKRIPTHEIEQTVTDLTALYNLDELPLLTTLRQSVHVVLKCAIDPLDKSKKYIRCSYNREGISFRSPWSNIYDPPIPSMSNDDVDTPESRSSDKLRHLEIQYNEVFSSYCESYYGKNVVSSVYLWEPPTNPSNTSQDRFVGCFLIHKSIDETDEHVHVRSGSWQSIHVVNVDVTADGQALYTLDTTIRLVMNPTDSSVESKCEGSSQANTHDVNISLSFTRQQEKTYSVQGSHIIHIGGLIEDTENQIRSSIDALYIQKTKEVIDALCTSNHEHSSHSASSHGNNHTSTAFKQNMMVGLNEAVLARVLKKSPTA